VSKKLGIDGKTLLTAIVILLLIGNIYFLTLLGEQRREAKNRVDRMIYEMGVIASLLEELVAAASHDKGVPLLLPIQERSARVSLRVESITLFYPSSPQALKDAHIIQKLVNYMNMTIQTSGMEVIKVGELTDATRVQFTKIAAIYRLLETGIVQRPRLSFRHGLFQEIATHFKHLDDGDLWQLIVSGGLK